METRRKITLPSGGTCVVRGLTGEDFLLVEADIPCIYSPGSTKPKRTTDKPSDDQIRAGLQFARVALLRGSSPITWPEGRRRIVEKDLDVCGADEITIGELKQADAQAICDAVIQLSGAGKEAADAARTFPAAQADGGDAGQVGA